ncbi:MAG: BadF/BadG/BcrA/BcrD ATPase family protein [Candidatus Methanomethyliaceae archaeon]
MPALPTYVIGIDGGGSKTDILFCSVRGQILAYKRIGSTRIEIVGLDRAFEMLWRAIANEMRTSHLPIKGLLAVALGLGGLDSARVIRLAENKARAVFPTTCLVSLWNDAQIGLYSGTLGRPGVCVVAGTGSLVVGMDVQKTWKRIGGWGCLFGDPGSAFTIGRLAIQACLRAKDGTGPSTSLSDSIKSFLNVKEIEEVVAEFTLDWNLTARVASIAPLVDKAAQQGDPVARRIIESEAGLLADDTIVLINSLSTNVSRIPVVLVGGCFNSLIFRETFVQRLNNQFQNSGINMEIIRPSWKPVLGAVIAALEGIGVQLSVDQVQRIGKSLNNASPKEDRDV